MKELGPEAEEGDQFGRHVVLSRPVCPILEIGFEGQVDKAVRECRRHSLRAGAVRLAVARGDDGPTVRHDVIAESAIKDKLVTRGLDERRRGV